MLSPSTTKLNTLVINQTSVELLNPGTSNTAKVRKKLSHQRRWDIPPDGLENIGSSTIGLAGTDMIPQENRQILKRKLTIFTSGGIHISDGTYKEISKPIDSKLSGLHTS